MQKTQHKDLTEKRFLVRIPKIMHYNLKILSADKNLPMAEIVRLALEEFLKSQKKNYKKT